MYNKVKLYFSIYYNRAFEINCYVLHKRKFNTAILLFSVKMKKESLVNSLINFLGRAIAF